MPFTAHDVHTSAPIDGILKACKEADGPWPQSPLVLPLPPPRVLPWEVFPGQIVICVTVAINTSALLGEGRGVWTRVQHASECANATVAT